MTAGSRDGRDTPDAGGVAKAASAPDESRVAEQARMLENRLRKRARHLRKWARREGISCYRLYDRDIPEIPLAIDRYEGHLYIAHYRRDDRDGDDDVAAADDDDAWRQAMVEATARALEVPRQRVHVKERRRQRGRKQYQKLDDAEMFLVVEEGGHRFAVNLDDYLDTGLFLDHRLTRARVASEAAGTRFLNLFCYTGAFTVYAAAAGARQTVSVDLSARYLDWAEKNLALNELGGRRHRLVRADVLEYLRRPVEIPFDLVVLDPPTFSNSKSMRSVLDLRRDHGELIRRTLALLRPGGVLYFSTNARRFRLDESGFMATTVEDLTEVTNSPDFRAAASHRCWRIVR